MIRSYILTAWRNIVNGKLYSVINIFCLSVGITGAILVSLFLNHEFSFDRHHTNHPDIFRVEGMYNIGGSVDHLAITPIPLGPTLKEEFDVIKNYVRFRGQTSFNVTTEAADFIEPEGFFYADSTIFEVFTHSFVYGQAEGSLSEPNRIVLTKNTSNKYFGEINPVGKTLRINNEHFVVTAVIEDVPDNSHLRFTALLSFITLENAYHISPSAFWSVPVNYTYVQLHQGATTASIKDNFSAFHEKYFVPAGQLISATAEFVFTPLAQTRFTEVRYSPPIASKDSLIVLMMVAIFLILLAAVNYTNLATARAGLRAREIAVRKVTGASAGEIFRQFLSESLVMSMMALLLSVLLVEILLPGFNTLADKEFTIRSLFSGQLFIQALLITLITGFLAGVYPAVVLSRMTPVSILKTGHSSQSSSSVLRKALVVFQFTISIILVAGTLTLQRQLNFIQNKELGLDIENRMSLLIAEHLDLERATQLENLISTHPDVLKTTKSGSIPAGGFSTFAIFAESSFGVKEGKIANNFVDYNFIDFYNITLTKGRNFDREMGTDRESAVIINQAAINYLGWSSDPIGKAIRWQLDPEGIPQRNLRVIGVMEDHHYLNLQNPIAPLMLQMPADNQPYHFISVKFRPGTGETVRNYIETTTREFDQNILPYIQYSQDLYAESFLYEQRLASIFGIFAFICIIVSFLGLFGLSAFLTQQRKREIGIRKVLGASSTEILHLFYKEFSILILLAIIIAIPPSWLLLDQWLYNFVFRIPMTATPLIIASVIAIAVAFTTVSYHTLRASALNPVKSIRSE